MTVHESDQRFRRPLDVTATRRNRHRVRATRILVFLTNLLLVTVLVAGGYWMFRRLQEDERFAIRSIEIHGVDDARRLEVTEVLDRWDGANLFRLEMDLVRHELISLDWVGTVALEKKLPGRLRVEVRERVPQAIIVAGGVPRFIDAKGARFGDASSSLERRIFPVIEDVQGLEARRSVAFLEALEASDQALHSRIERIRPAEGAGWEIVDRDLGTLIRLDEHDGADKWRMLYRIVAAEQFDSSAIEYADLRFDDQIVIARTRKIVQK
jgi:cell division protein FtsQ